ncbi:MAG: sugar ABC transporter substrate-binding protein [Gemmatimonadaceae bacterium]|nr:sugar ABC transporter substrate-binding protein [Gemmatimonadaceae bacterium]
MRTRRAVIGLASVASLLASACARDEAVTLRITSWQSPEENAIDAVEYRAFEAAHPGVRIVNDPVSNSAEYREKVLTSIGAGSPPDVFLLDGIDVAAFASRDVVLDLAPFAERVGVQLGLFFPQVVEPFRVNGKLLAFPKGFSPMVYYYNRELFTKAGLALPKQGWTQEEFLAAARALTRDTNGDGVVDQWGTVLDRHLYAWQAWVWSAGADILTPDGTRATGALDQSAAVQTIGLLTNLPRRGLAPPPSASGGALGFEQRLFYSGKLGLMTSGHWMIPRMRRYLEQGRVQLGVVSVPRTQGHQVKTPLFASGWAVPYNTPHRKLAVELAAWMVRADAQRRRAASGLEIPTLMTVAYANAASDPTGMEMDFLWQVPYGGVPWGARVASYREIERAMLDLIDRVVVERVPVGVAVGEAARAVDAMLRR